MPDYLVKRRPSLVGVDMFMLCPDAMMPIKKDFEADKTRSMLRQSVSRLTLDTLADV